MQSRAILVTGASRGIGAAAARAFAASGDRVAVHYGTRREHAEEVASSLHGDGHVVVGGDLADPAAVRAFVDAAAEGLGGLDVLVNNAGIYVAHPIADTSYDAFQAAWQSTLAVNLVGAANVTWCAVRHMLAAGRGRIVNVGSRGASRGDPDHTAYAASKAGLTAFGQTLARELGPHAITVMTVAPGFVSTDMAAPYLAGPEGAQIAAQSPLNRVATAEEVAAAIHFLASPQAEMATGTVLDVNGGSYLRM
jgi:3-oxoacyl-[acyl-carrier protein] reductase